MSDPLSPGLMIISIMSEAAKEILPQEISEDEKKDCFITMEGFKNFVARVAEKFEKQYGKKIKKHDNRRKKN